MVSDVFSKQTFFYGKPVSYFLKVIKAMQLDLSIKIP